MFERRVYFAKLRGLVLQLVHDEASVRRGNHSHGVHLHLRAREVEGENNTKSHIFNDLLTRDYNACSSSHKPLTTSAQ